jgi:hypothetical protein
MANDPLGWTITVRLPGGSMPQVYNVAISDERDAIEAVKRTLPDTSEVIVKVKGELFERVYNALKMKPGDVLLGAQRRKKAKRLTPAASA